MIALLSNGKFIVTKSERKLKKYGDVIKYVLINNDTSTRTDVYTMIKGEQLLAGNPNNINRVKLELNYSDDDSGYDPDFNLRYTFGVNNACTQFNIYPLIKQISDLNSYKDTVAELTENRLRPIDIKFITDKDALSWNENDDAYLSDIFESNNMRTCLRKLKDDYIFLKGDKWARSSFIPPEFDYIGYPIRDSENLQLIPFDLFNKLIQIYELNIIVHLYNGNKEYEEDELSGIINIYETEFEGILAHMFYLQTVLELDRYILDPHMMYNVCIYATIGNNPYEIVNYQYHEPRHVYIPFNEIINGVSFYQKLSEIL